MLTRRNENRNKEVVKILDDLLDAEVHVDYIKEAVLNTTRKSAIEAMNYYLSFDVARYQEAAEYHFLDLLRE